MTCISEWELSLHTNRRQTPLSHVSACEKTSLATISALPSVPHNATQRHPPGGHIISASDPAPSQLPTRSFAAYSHCAPHSSYPIGVAQTECLERHQLEDGRPCTEYAEYKTVLGAMHVLEEIDVNKVCSERCPVHIGFLSPIRRLPMRVMGQVMFETILW